MSIKSPTAIPRFQHEEMKEEQCTFSDIYFSLNTQLELWSGRQGLGLRESGTHGPLFAWFTN